MINLPEIASFNSSGKRFAFPIALTHAISVSMETSKSSVVFFVDSMDRLLKKNPRARKLIKTSSYFNQVVQEGRGDVFNVAPTNR